MTRPNMPDINTLFLRLEQEAPNRRLDVVCAEYLEWRWDRDHWWNWHPGPRFDPPGDEWCIRRDGRSDIPCNEALPSFTVETFKAELAKAGDLETEETSN